MSSSASPSQQSGLNSPQSMLGSAPHPLWRLLRVLLISSGIGLGLALIVGLNDPSALRPLSLFSYALTGVCIAFGSVVGEWVLLPRLLAVGLRPPLVARSVCYFFGGMFGYSLAHVLIMFLYGVGWSYPEPMGAMRAGAVFGAMAVVIGVTLHTIDLLRGNLAEKEKELREKEYAERELETARQIQQRLMPPEVAEGPGFNLCARNRAASIVAGDFYDYFYLPDGTMGFAIADVVGKGMGASLQMAVVKAVLPMIAAERVKTDNPVAGTLDDLNERLCRELGAREFVALMYGRFDPAAQTMEFANAGLPDPYWVCRGEADELHLEALSAPGDRLPLGIRSETRYQSEVCQANVPGVMVMVTDGLIERQAGNGPLGYERFESILAEVAESLRDGGNSATEWLDLLQARLDAASGTAPEDDDCTIMVIHSNGEANSESVSSPDTAVAEQKVESAGQAAAAT